MIDVLRWYYAGIDLDRFGFALKMRNTSNSFCMQHHEKYQHTRLLQASRLLHVVDLLLHVVDLPCDIRLHEHLLKQVLSATSLLDGRTELPAGQREDDRHAVVVALVLQPHHFVLQRSGRRLLHVRSDDERGHLLVRQQPGHLTEADCVAASLLVDADVLHLELPQAEEARRHRALELRRQAHVHVLADGAMRGLDVALGFGAVLRVGRVAAIGQTKRNELFICLQIVLGHTLLHLLLSLLFLVLLQMLRELVPQRVRRGLFALCKDLLLQRGRLALLDLRLGQVRRLHFRRCVAPRHEDVEIALAFVPLPRGALRVLLRVGQQRAILGREVAVNTLANRSGFVRRDLRLLLVEEELPRFLITSFGRRRRGFVLLRNEWLSICTQVGLAPLETGRCTERHCGFLLGLHLLVNSIVRLLLATLASTHNVELSYFFY